MTIPPAPSSVSRSARGLWLTALLAALAAAGARYKRGESEAARQQKQAQERAVFAQRQEIDWRAQAERQSQVVREELEHLVKVRLPAALALAEIPAGLHPGEELGMGVAQSLDQMLAEVSQTVSDREESRRLALVELASRVQTSAHRIQGAMVGLADRHPGDPDLLETTMRVDHAATQQARHAQSLKVLCGEWPGQQWQKPLAMVDVVRAASGRIVAFNRVEVTGDLSVGVTPSIVEPLIHLLAELLANATEYSPPKTAVPVTVRTVQRGAVIEVDDGGLGLDEYRLSQAREIVSGRRLLGVGEVGEIPQTGLAVVGRFAHRHGFDVDLGPSPYGGVRAVILVPTNVLETIELVGAGAPTRSEPKPPTKPTTPSARSAEPRAASALSRTPAVEPTAPEPTSKLPQRRSRRDEFAAPPVVDVAPVAVTAPGTPDEAGSWMEQFLEGGRTTAESESPEGQG